MSIFDFGGYQYFKYELLSLSGGEYSHTGWITDYVTNASINIDFDRSIISAAYFNIKNLTEINFLTDLIKPYLCFRRTPNDLTYEIPLGQYMLLSPVQQVSNNFNNRQIYGYDLLKALDQDTTIASTTITSGTNIVEAIESIIESVGSWAKHQIEPSVDILEEDFSFELGKSKLFIINSLLNMINYYPLWMNGNGIFKAIPWTPVPNVVHEFVDNELSLYEDNVILDVDYSNLYNRVVIIANQLKEDTAPLYKSWTLEDEGLENHPFSYTNINRYVTKIFQTDAISQHYVDLRARREIRKMMEIEETISFNHAFVTSRMLDGIPYAGDCYKFTNNNLNLSYIYKIIRQSYALNTGITVASNIRRMRLT